MNCKTRKVEFDMEINGLALEYQLVYGSASRDLKVEDLMNNPSANGLCSINGLGLAEHPSNAANRHSGPVLHDGAYSSLIAQYGG